MKLLRLSLPFLLLSGCAVESFTKDTEAPRITNVIPTTLKAEYGNIEILFSEPVVNVKSMDGCFRFAKTADVSESALRRFAKLRNAEGMAPFLPITATLSEAHDKVSIVLPAKLGFTESYSLWIFDCIRDHAGNRLAPLDLELGVSEFRFKVEEGPFALLSHDLELPGESGVAPNRRYFHFRFSHPLADTPTDALLLDGQPVSATLSADRRTLRAQLDTPLTPDTAHAFSFAATLRDHQHRTLETLSLTFKTQSTLRAQEAVMIRDLRVLSYEDRAVINFRVPYLERATLRYGQAPEDLGATIDSTLELFDLQNLEPLAAYYYELQVENIFGQKDVSRGSFQLKAVASLAINEILASPKLKKGEPDASAEFIELFNYGDEPIDVSRFSIEVSGKTCALTKKKDPLVIAAKSYVLIVGKKFEPANFGLKDSDAIWRVPRQSICGNLRNWPLPRIVLLDDQERVVDLFEGMKVRKEKGISVERLNPSEKNGKERYCYSRSDVGPTPLRANGVVEKGCEDS